jgi:hypothetical protein
LEFSSQPGQFMDGHVFSFIRWTLLALFFTFWPQEVKMATTLPNLGNPTKGMLQGCPA